jgi:hypothetical protein
MLRNILKADLQNGLDAGDLLAQALRIKKHGCSLLFF